MLSKCCLHLSQARGGFPRPGGEKKKPSKQRCILPNGNPDNLLMISCWKLRKHFSIGRSNNF